MADITSKDNRTSQFAKLESSFLVGTVAGPLIGGFLFLISNETPFYVFSFLGFVAALGISFIVSLSPGGNVELICDQL